MSRTGRTTYRLIGGLGLAGLVVSAVQAQTTHGLACKALMPEGARVVQAYSGDCVQGLAQGKGRVIFELAGQGSVMLDGDFAEGQLHGRGQRVTRKAIQQGQWKQGAFVSGVFVAEDVHGPFAQRYASGHPSQGCSDHGHLGVPCTEELKDILARWKERLVQLNAGSDAPPARPTSPAAPPRNAQEAQRAWNQEIRAGMAQWERETARGVAEQRAREQETAKPTGFVASALPKGFNCPSFGRDLVWRATDSGQIVGEQCAPWRDDAGQSWVEKRACWFERQDDGSVKFRHVTEDYDFTGNLGFKASASRLPKRFIWEGHFAGPAGGGAAQAHQPMSSEYRLVFELFRSRAQEQQTLQPPVMGQHPCFSRLRENDLPDVPLRGDLVRIRSVNKI